jgi:hypothetical protein
MIATFAKRQPDRISANYINVMAQDVRVLMLRSAASRRPCLQIAAEA